jgi:calcineurin-like phosphoesterase family protein
MQYFTSDNHFFHRNIIKYCNRPFRDVTMMNEIMISNWNNIVGPDDEVYCLGDFGFADRDELEGVLDRLMGRKHLIKGNHDKEAKRLRGWVWVKDYMELKVEEDFVILFHYAPRVWNKSHHGSLALFGHSHGRMPGNSQSLDVGVDCWNYKPVTLVEIKKRMATLPPFVGYREQAGGADHHVAREL